MHLGPVGVEWWCHGMLPKSGHRGFSITNWWPIVVFGWNQQCWGRRLGSKAPCRFENIRLGIFLPKLACPNGLKKHVKLSDLVAPQQNLRPCRHLHRVGGNTQVEEFWVSFFIAAFWELVLFWGFSGNAVHVAHTVETFLCPQLLEP